MYQHGLLHYTTEHFVNVVVLVFVVTFRAGPQCRPGARGEAPRVSVWAPVIPQPVSALREPKSMGESVGP